MKLEVALHSADLCQEKKKASGRLEGTEKGGNIRLAKRNHHLLGKKNKSS